jgi:hypothetical protein
MGRLVLMRRGVPAGRVVAAANVTAREADPQVQPLAAGTETIFAAVNGAGQLADGYLIEMRADLTHDYSTVTVFARFRGWSTFKPRSRAILYASSWSGITASGAWRKFGVRGT